MRIYNKDGTHRVLSEDEVDIITITPDSINKVENYKNGVNIYFKDGTFKFIDKAKTDGIGITLNYESE
ncbi:hypothetical protein [Halalkalibacter oceani]|uniref:hypothetical protein n=1 Tax=Halalkalibacter oceani TaxID=1653776 RepID=UPI003396B905